MCCGTLRCEFRFPPWIHPPIFRGEGLDQFQTYLLSAPHKAFAVSAAGSAALSAGHRTTQESEKYALEKCKKLAPKNSACNIMLIDDQKANN